jgi:uncharacterized membrane-anchored protein
VARPARTFGWLSALVILPVGVWFEASRAHGFAGKSVSNLSLEPVAIAVLGALVFAAWYFSTRSELSPLAGLILLVLLAAAAFAIQRFVPGLHE